MKDFLLNVGVFLSMLFQWKLWQGDCILDGEPNDENEYLRHMGPVNVESEASQ